MRLLFEPCGLEIEIQEGEISGICIEQPVMFRRFTESLWNQENALEGGIFLTQGDKALKLNRDGSVIFNPYSIDINEKKILNHLYDEMREMAEHDFYSKKEEINAAVIGLLDEMDLHLPYPLEYSLNLDFLQLLKLYGVKIEMQGTTLMERIVNYVRLSHQIMGTGLFVFVHLKDYFTSDELTELREATQYEQVSVLMVENRMDSEKNNDDNWWIVDKDLCIIEM